MHSMRNLSYVLLYALLNITGAKAGQFSLISEFEQVQKAATLPNVAASCEDTNLSPQPLGRILCTLDNQDELISSYENQLLKWQHPVQRASYQPQKQVFEQAGRLKTLAGQEAFYEWYKSQFFYDRSYLIHEIKPDAGDTHHPKVYDYLGQRPFDGYLSSHKVLQDSTPENLTIETMSALQESLLSSKSILASDQEIIEQDQSPKTNSEFTGRDLLGRLRIDPIVYKDYKQSISSGILIDLPSKTISERLFPLSEVSKNNPLLEVDGHVVEYLPLHKWETFEGLSEKTRSALKNLDHLTETEEQKLRTQVVQEMAEYELTLLKKSLRTVTTQNELLEAVGRFHHQLLSIHPYGNGNGRVTRELTEWILKSYGIAPPLWINFGIDVAASRSEFISHLKQSVWLSEVFHHDLLALMRAGLNYQLTPSPYLSFDSGAFKLAHDQFQEIVPEEYMTWLSYSNLRPTSPLAKEPEKRLNQFLEWKHRLKYETRVDPKGIRLATPLLQTTFGLSPNEEIYQLKMLHLYHLDEPVYRGVFSGSVPTDTQIIENFTKTTPALLGMGVSPALEAKEAVKGPFKTFNSDLIHNKLKLGNQLLGHVRGGANSSYYDSNLVSFSHNLEVAQSFTAPLSVMAPKRKSGILIQAANRRFAAIETAPTSYELKFKSEYPHEREVLFVGAADPECVETVTVYAGATKRVATRTGFDTVRLEHFDEDGNSIQSRNYLILRDGRIQEIKSKL